MEVRKDNNLEFLRLIATVGVVFVHIGVCWISSFGENASIQQTYIFAIIQHSMFWAVPVFMMITGALLMRKSDITYLDAWRYFKRIAILLLTFGTLFAWLELFFKEHTVSVDLLRDGGINMLEGHSWKHLWYLYMLLGIYLVLPILNRLKNLTPPICLS